MSAFLTTVHDDGTRTTVPANMREHRENKRAEAEARNALTLPENRRAFRHGPDIRLLAAIFGSVGIAPSQADFELKA